MQLISPAARCTRVTKFINTQAFSRVCKNTFVFHQPWRVSRLHLHTHTFGCDFPLSHMPGLWEHTHTVFHLLAAGSIAWKMNTKCRAKWLAGITLAVCSSPPALPCHKTRPPPCLPHKVILFVDFVGDFVCLEKTKR